MNVTITATYPVGVCLMHDATVQREGDGMARRVCITTDATGVPARVESYDVPAVSAEDSAAILAATPVYKIA